MSTDTLHLPRCLPAASHKSKLMRMWLCSAFGGNAGMCNAASGGFYYPDSYNTPCDNASSFTNHPGGYYMPSALSGPSIAPTEGPAASTGASSLLSCLSYR